MSAHRRRPLLYAGLGVALIWLLAWAGYSWSGASKVTAEKVASYLRTTDLSRLSPNERARALRDLAKQMNALTVDERRRARLDGEWDRWFSQMTDEEKAAFIESTLPSGFKQMITSFEELPEEKRKEAVDRAMAQLQKTREAIENGDPTDPRFQGRAGRSGELSPELQDKIVTLGLKSFYSESSAQTKAELAPVLEEMQRLMERGGLFRRGRRR